uniref:Uncharacterized protein n=1 Tax=Setaria viridis TaxID=4556 RepID=A0A4U6TBC2_SETVI|nr:hypothetical protein SEVIR_8G035666v2 [Setaria viridis]
MRMHANLPASCLPKPKETRKQSIQRRDQIDPMESPSPPYHQCYAVVQEPPVISVSMPAAVPRAYYHCSAPGRPAACMCLSLVSSFLRFLASAAVAALSLSLGPAPPRASMLTGALRLSAAMSRPSVSEQGSSSVSSSAVAPPAGLPPPLPAGSGWNAACCCCCVPAYAADGDPRGSATTG